MIVQQAGAADVFVVTFGPIWWYRELRNCSFQETMSILRLRQKLCWNTLKDDDFAPETEVFTEYFR